MIWIVKSCLSKRENKKGRLKYIGRMSIRGVEKNGMGGNLISQSKMKNNG